MKLPSALMRWYQLSMLQMLVGIAVVAMFLAMQIPHTREAGTARADDGPEFTLLVTEAGWPWQFIGKLSSLPSQNWLEGTVRVSYEIQDIYFVPFLADIFVGLALLLSVLALTARLHARC